MVWLYHKVKNSLRIYWIYSCGHSVCVYLLSFPRYKDILVENRDFYIPPVFTALFQADLVGILPRYICVKTRIM